MPPFCSRTFDGSPCTRPSREVCGRGEVPAASGRATDSVPCSRRAPCAQIPRRHILPNSAGINHSQVTAFGQRDYFELVVVDEDECDFAGPDCLIQFHEFGPMVRNFGRKTTDIWLDDLDPRAIAGSKLMRNFQGGTF